MADPPVLEKIRREIGKDLVGFKAAYNEKKFKAAFGSLAGEQQKRLPEEFKELALKEPLIANKQFYYSASMPSKIITSNDLPDQLMEYYIAAKGVNAFLRRAF